MMAFNVDRKFADKQNASFAKALHQAASDGYFGAAQGITHDYFLLWRRWCQVWAPHLVPFIPQVDMWKKEKPAGNN
jgi:hypothetical protein